MKELTLLSETVESLYHALGALDGFQKLSDKGVPALVPYKFTDETRKLIVKNRRALKATVESLKEARSDLVAELTCDENHPDGLGYIGEDDVVRQGAFQVAMSKRLKESVVVKIYPIDEAALLCENKNPIPGSIMELLAPVWDTDFQKEEGKSDQPEGGDA